MPLQILCCRKCNFKTKSLIGYVNHCKLHSNVPNFAFPCGVQRCFQTFKTSAGFKSHFTRFHSSVKNINCNDEANCEGARTSYECAVSHCKQLCVSLTDFIHHIKDHISTKTAVFCPFLNCHKKFKSGKVSTFTAHLSRYHKGWSHTNIDERYVVTSAVALDPLLCDSSMPVEDTEHDNDESMHIETDYQLSDAETESLLLRKLALFTLNLQVKHHVASSVVQEVIFEFGDLMFNNMNAVREKINSLISELIPKDAADGVIQAITGHPLSASLDMKSGPLRSEHMRTGFYKKSFHYVEPVTVSLNSFAADEECKVFHYIPLMKSLQALYADPTINEHMKTLHEHSVTNMNDGMLRDFTDGRLCQEDSFLQSNPNAIKILLYQDEFEVVNPIGVARGKHKLLAVYYSLGNLNPSVRSKIDGLQLALLCKSKYLKEFGEEAIFKPLIEDLTKLRKDGIDLGPDFGIRRGTVVFALGDNLGSHMLGGFVQSFSGKFFCRFCLATSDCLTSGKCMPDEFARRTPERYNDAVANVDQNHLECFEGIKKNSVLHAVPEFHVCKPALPPCLGHDLFEGVIPPDLTMCLKYLVKERKWFSYNYLNQRIIQLKLVGAEANDKPCIIHELTGKVVGNAVQVWVFIRFLPILIGSKIVDTDDKVWQLILLMRDVVELVCAPAVSKQLVVAMSDKIEEYIESRCDCFPEKPLRPKHHFLTHYPSLTLQCGPLIHLWTLRFESKHSYFKMSARAAKNFVNITKTLAEKHQLLQAYYSTGSLFGQALQIKDGLPFNVDMFNSNIVSAVQRFPQLKLDNKTVTSTSITLNSISYSKGSYLILKRENEQLISGEIKMILVHNNSSIYFIVVKKQTTYLVDMGLYEVSDELRELWLCVNIHELIDVFPLNIYRVGFGNFFALRHAV